MGKGQPVLLPTGYLGHGVAAFVWKSRFILIDRSGEKRNIAAVFEFNINKLDNTVLDKIKNNARTKEDYDKFFFEELQTTLDLKQGVFEKELEEAFIDMIMPQTAGNCAWAAPEGAIGVFMMFSELLGDDNGELNKQVPNSIDKDLVKAIKNKFNEWVAFNQIYNLEIYLGPRHLRGEDPEKLEKSEHRRKIMALDHIVITLALQTIKKTIPANSASSKDLHQIIAKSLFLPLESTDDSLIQQHYDDAERLLSTLDTSALHNIVKKIF